MQILHMRIKFDTLFTWRLIWVVFRIKRVELVKKVESQDTYFGCISFKDFHCYCTKVVL